MENRQTGFSGRRIGAFVALWLGWTLAFSLAHSAIDALIHNRVPRPGFMVLIFAAALTAVFIGKGLWPGWRGALGLISIVFALFNGAIGLWRHTPVSDDLGTARPAASLVALAVSVTGSVVIGAVLLHAERLRRRG